MQKQINIYHFVSLPKTLAIEQTIVSDVIPLVDTGQTRGGRILSQVLLKHEEGLYLWLINYETTGGNWHEENIAPARAKLETLAVIYATYSLRLLDSQARESIDSVGFDKTFPIGQLGAMVRIYQLKPGRDRNQEWFEQEMTTQVLPAVNLHPANRLGHSTDTQMLLKLDGLVEDGRYQWLISRSLHESFKDRDTIPGDIHDALEKFEALGSIHSFADYRVMHSTGL